MATVRENRVRYGERGAQPVQGEHPIRIAPVGTLSSVKVSRGLKALSEKGLVADDEDTADRRRRRSVLTADGERAYLEAFKIVRQVYLQNFDGISDEEFATLMRLLRRIKDNVFRTEAY